MSKKLQQIMLIDDHEASNFYNQITLERLGLAEQLLFFDNAPDALDYLRNLVPEHSATPELLLLDVNMPGMTGWEFLHEYEKLPPAQHAQCVYTMISTALNAEDHERAKANRLIDGFVAKPLTGKSLNEVLARHFGVQAGHNS